MKGTGMKTALRKRSISPFGRVALAALALTLLLAVSAPGCGSSEQGGSGLWLKTEEADRRLAPDFTLVDLKGNQVTLSDYRGNVVLVHFWATWCPSCREGMPIIKEFYQEHGGGDVVVIGVAAFETAVQARNYVRDGGYDWTIALDSSGQVTRSYGVFVIPTYFFVDREGLIRALSISPVTESELESKLAELAAEPRV